MSWFASLIRSLFFSYDRIGRKVIRWYFNGMFWIREQFESWYGITALYVGTAASLIWWFVWLVKAMS